MDMIGAVAGPLLGVALLGWAQGAHMARRIGAVPAGIVAERHPRRARGYRLPWTGA